MRLWIDTEFNGYQGALISVALVDEDGREFYESVGCADPEPWVAQNVMPIIGRPPVPLAQLQAGLEVWMRAYTTVHVVADWPDDIGHFCRLLITGPGERISTPPLTLEVRRDIEGDSMCPHNALADARSIRRAHLSLERRETASAGVQGMTAPDLNYLCRAWGESDLTSAELVRDWDGVRRFMVREWLGAEDATDDDGTVTLDRLKVDFDEHEEDRRGGQFTYAFEIGGISIERVCGNVDLPAAAHPLPQPVAEDDLRADFERLNSTSVVWGHKRSRRGTYVNPAVARDWKWFRLGALGASQPASVKGTAV